jgi:hypothetical protein
MKMYLLVSYALSHEDVSLACLSTTPWRRIGGVEVYEGVSKFPDWLDNEINNNNKHSLRSNTMGYGSKTH